MWAEAGLEVASIDIPSWDHHTEQGVHDGPFARRLGMVAQSLDAFSRDIRPFWDRTLVLVMSEFGRTCRENGNFGSDHGHGGFMLALGGKVKGGEILGKWTRLRDDMLYEGRDLPVTTDFRDVFHEVLQGHFECQLPRDFFPDFKPRRGVGLI